MRLFMSKRERLLWLAVAAVVVAIYSTIGLTGWLADSINNKELVETAWIWGLLVATAVVIATGFTKRLSFRDVFFVIGVASAYWMVLVRSSADFAERTHLFEYGILAVLIHEALSERRVKHRLLLAVAIAASIGLIDETIQGLFKAGSSTGGMSVSTHWPP